MKILSRILKHKNPYPAFKTIQKNIQPNTSNWIWRIGQSIWNQFFKQNPWENIWNNTFYSYCWPENNNEVYIILHYATRTNDHIYRWANQKHLKSPNCKLCDQTENINHLHIHCKRNKKIWKHSQKYYKCLTKKNAHHCNTY